jgi:hypothetical protein
MPLGGAAVPLEKICTNRLQILRTATREERERGASWSLSIERSKNIDADLKTQTKDNYVRKHVHELDRLIMEFAMIQG